MKSKDAVQIKRNREEPSLDGRYGKIGISAVAAAVAFKGEVKTPTEAADTRRAQQWLAERAAA